MLFSQTPFSSFWAEVGFPTLVEGAYATEEELVGKWASGLARMNGYILAETGMFVEADGTDWAGITGAPALNNPAYKKAKGPGWMRRLGSGIANMFSRKKPAAAPGAPDPTAAAPEGDVDWAGITGPPALNNPAYKKSKAAAGPTAGPTAGGQANSLSGSTQEKVNLALNDIKSKLGAAITNVLQTMQKSNNKIGWQVAKHVNDKLDGIISGFKFQKGEGKFDTQKAWGATQDQAGGEDYKAALQKMAGGGGVSPTVGSMMPQPKAGPGGMQKLLSDPSTQGGMIQTLAQQLGADPEMVRRLVVDAGITDPEQIKGHIERRKAAAAGGGGGGMATAGASQTVPGAGVPKQKKEHAKKSRKGDKDLMESLIRGAGKRPTPANPMG